MILILHEARTGNEILIRPEDVKYGEARDKYTILAHLMPIPVPGVETPQGKIIRPPSVAVIVKETEVMESVDEIQRMGFQIAQIMRGEAPASTKVVIQRHRDTAIAIATASFGNGPRHDSAKPIVEIARD